MNLHKHVWTEALQMNDFHEDGKKNVDSMQRLVELAEGYEKRVREESTLTKEQLKTRYVGKVDPKKRKSATLQVLSLMLTIVTDIEDVGQQLIEDNIVAVSRQMINKESSVARVPNGQDTENEAQMDVDDEKL